VCQLCGLWGGKQHWTEWGPRSDKRAERLSRNQLLDKILRHYDVNLSPWAGEGYLVSPKKGPTQLASSIPNLWLTVENISGRKCDPLDKQLLADLGNEQ